MKNKITKQRSYQVIKSNEIIQKARFTLSVQQQRMLLYAISKIKPTDDANTEYEMDIGELCEVCGIDKNNGYYYQTLKSDIQRLSDASAWIMYPDGHEELFRWINTVKTKPKSGIIKIKFHESVQPYLFDLKTRFTQYELINVLAFRSKYSIRLYELLKSYSNLQQISFDIETLKRLIDAQNYSRFPDFRVNVIEPAIKEINTLSTDIRIDYTWVKSGRKTTGILFELKKISMLDHIIAGETRRKILNRETPKQQCK